MNTRLTSARSQFNQSRCPANKFAHSKLERLKKKASASRSALHIRLSQWKVGLDLLFCSPTTSCFTTSYVSIKISFPFLIFWPIALVECLTSTYISFNTTSLTERMTPSIFAVNSSTQFVNWVLMYSIYCPKIAVLKIVFVHILSLIGNIFPKRILTFHKITFLSKRNFIGYRFISLIPSQTTNERTLFT